MTLDLTKPVQTRDGRKVEIVTTKGREPYPVLGFIGELSFPTGWSADGAFELGTPSHHDLINTPEPKRVVDFWAHVYADGSGKLLASKAGPDIWGKVERITRVHVRWTEGRGAEIIND